MAKRTPPIGGFYGSPQGNAVWLSATKVLVARFIQAGESPAEISIMLAISNDAGATWTSIESSAFLFSGSMGMSPDIQNPQITSVSKDSSNNIYVHRAGKLIKYTKGSGDTWTGVAYDITGWGGGAYGSLLFVTGTNAITIFAAVNDSYEVTIHKYVTTNLTSWTKTTEASSSGSGDRKFWYRAGALIGGVPTVVYGTRAGSSSTFSQGGLGNMAQADFDRRKAVQIVTTNDGKTHMVYLEQENTGDLGLKFMYVVKTGSTWSTPVEIREAPAGTYIASNGDYVAASKAGYGDYYLENNKYLSLQTDGVGLFLFWVEVTSPIDIYRIRSISWNGTAWSTPTDHATYDSNDDVNFFMMYGPYAQGNFGRGHLMVLEDNSVFYYDDTINYPPTPPINLAPASGFATTDLTPDLSWLFTHPNGGESQSAYQIIVYRQSDSTVMWDSGKVTSTSQTATYAGTTLVYGVTYQWKVKTWDQVDNEGTYSTLAVFKESQAPVGTITYPADEEVINTDTPLIEWTYTDSEATAQSKYRVEILNAAGDTVLHNSGLILSADDYYQMPTGTLINGESYRARLTVVDSDNISSTPTVVDFDVEFVAPPAPDLSAAFDGEGNIELTIDLNPPEDAAWPVDTIKIYKKLPSDDDFSLIETGIPVTAAVIDNFDTTTGWASSSVGTTPIVDDPKHGIQSLGLGTSGAGDGIYTKTISVANVTNYNELQAWLYVTDPADFAYIRIKLGTDSSNYYYFDIDSADIDAGIWKSVSTPISDMLQVGSPINTNYTWARIEIQDATGAIPAGDIRIDLLRLIQTHYVHTDYDVANGYSYLYGATTFNIDENLESTRTESSLVDVNFNELGINTYIIPIGMEGAAIKGFMDGSVPPSWTDKTDTKYYQTKGSTKPTVVVNGIQNYKEGSVEFRFFDPQFGGDGLPGVEALEYIRNVKPLLLKTWWGKNYYISIDGELSTVRKPGIGWYSNFNFTEINP